MSKSIKLSPKHGVNPSMCICFFCKKEKGIALLGHLKGDVEAPKQVITDYEPCDECKENFKNGILVIACDTEPRVEGQSPIQEGCYPTGCWAVAKEEPFLKSLRGVDEETINHVKEKRTCLVDQNTFDNMVGE